MTNEELWQLALGEIELSISKASFNTWFKNTAILEKKDGRVIISVPTGFAKEWLENKYNQYILQALKNIDPTIQSAICSISLINNNEKPNNLNSHLHNQSLDVVLPPKKPINSLNLKSNLNPRYTFKNFIIGSSNELAQAACFAVSQSLGEIYNPLFIYGKVGLGKTHLIQSIGNEIIRFNPQKKVKYISSERFTSDLIDSIKNQTIDKFKDYYQKIDLLIIDDIQFISGKEKTQEEFFHIFNYLYQADKQIVLSSDCPPKDIQILEDRLRSRFEGGMIADVSQPDLETRMAILRHKALSKNLTIDEISLEFIAKNIKNNIRELEGALNRVLVSAQLSKKDLDLDYTKQILADIISSGKKKDFSYKHILNTVSSFYEVSLNDLITKNRKQEIVKPRQVAMFLIREELHYSYPGIGDKLGGRDHTTVMYACRKIAKDIQNDNKLAEEISYIKDQIYTIH